MTNPSSIQEPKYGFWPFVLPFVAFMALTMLEPSFPDSATDILNVAEDDEANPDEQAEIDEYVLQERHDLANRFFMQYALKVVVISGLLIYFRRVYLEHFPWKFQWAVAVLVGVVGIVIWVPLCGLGVESWLFEFFGGQPTVRSHFNPFVQLSEHWQLVAFLGIRFFGLAVMVPICEELFLRGFLMRHFESTQWWKVNLSQLALRTMLVAPIYGALAHPTEAVAAIAWFSLVTWLVQRTGNLWDAVVAHSVTNFLLGLYVCVFAQWQLW